MTSNRISLTSGRAINPLFPLPVFPERRKQEILGEKIRMYDIG